VAGEGFVQDAVLADPLEVDRGGQQPLEVVVGDGADTERGRAGEEHVPVGRVGPGASSVSQPGQQGGAGQVAEEL